METNEKWPGPIILKIEKNQKRIIQLRKRIYLAEIYILCDKSICRVEDLETAEIKLFESTEINEDKITHELADAIKNDWKNI